jgi:hypothetical protein
VGRASALRDVYLCSLLPAHANLTVIMRTQISRSICNFTPCVGG